MCTAVKGLWITVVIHQSGAAGMFTAAEIFSEATEAQTHSHECREVSHPEGD